MNRLCVLLAVVAMIASDTPAQVPVRISLGGEWFFRADSLGVGDQERWFDETTDRSGWERVSTPDYWERYPGLAAYDGVGWFARSFTVPQVPGPMSIHFAGVDDDAAVWINGIDVGSHTGYSDPFALDVSKALRPGENLIVVLVRDYSGGGGIYAPITLIENRFLDQLLKGPYHGVPALKCADWVRSAVIYSVYLRSFSSEGTFGGLEKRLPELKKLGVTVLWLMPIHPVGVRGRKGTLGSPYAVRDYYAVNPEFGTMADFRRLVQAIHREGMKVIIDLVANHTSWDNSLIEKHPDWYTHDAAGQIVPPNADWTDVADLDYSKPALRQYMMDMMAWWVRDIGIDGFRCDVAELVPTDFWEEARTRLNRIKSVMMLSEGSLPEHHVRAFDITYAWTIYDALEPLLTGRRPVALLDQILRNEELLFPTGSLRLRFTTNHDKNAWDAPAVKKFGEGGLKLGTVLVNTLPGVPLIYTGEEVPNPKKLSLFEKVPVDWSKGRRMEKLYRTLFRLRREHAALSRGQMVRVETSAADSVYAFLRMAGSDRILVLLNFSPVPVSFQLRLAVERVFPGKTSFALESVVGGKSVKTDASALPSWPFELQGHGYSVFVVR